MLGIGVDSRSHPACPAEAEHEPADRHTASPTEALVTPEEPLQLAMEKRRHTGVGSDLGLANVKTRGVCRRIGVCFIIPDNSPLPGTCNT